MILGELVSKLTEGEGRYDGILEAVRKDPSIPEPVRSLLMDYFGEAGILAGRGEELEEGE